VCQNTHACLLLETDSEAAMLAIDKAFSAREGMLTPIRETLSLAAQQFTRLRVRDTPRVFPTMIIADKLSRNDYQEAACDADKVFDQRLSLVWSPVTP
jgi:hypothetical protein